MTDINQTPTNLRTEDLPVRTNKGPEKGQEPDPPPKSQRTKGWRSEAHGAAVVIVTRPVTEEVTLALRAGGYRPDSITPASVTYVRSEDSFRSPGAGRMGTEDAALTLDETAGAAPRRETYQDRQCDNLPKLLLTPEEAAHSLGVGRTKLYELLKTGALGSVQIGGSRRIPVGELANLVAGLINAKTTNQNSVNQTSGVVEMLAPGDRQRHNGSEDRLEEAGVSACRSHSSRQQRTGRSLPALSQQTGAGSVTPAGQSGGELPAQLGSGGQLIRVRRCWSDLCG